MVQSQGTVGVFTVQDITYMARKLGERWSILTYGALAIAYVETFYLEPPSPTALT